MQLPWILKHLPRHPVFDGFQNLVGRRHTNIGANHYGFQVLQHVGIDFLLALDEILNLLGEILFGLLDRFLDLLEDSGLFLLRRSE